MVPPPTNFSETLMCCINVYDVQLSWVIKSRTSRGTSQKKAISFPAFLLLEGQFMRVLYKHNLLGDNICTTKINSSFYVGDKMSTVLN